MVEFSPATREARVRFPTPNETFPYTTVLLSFTLNSLSSIAIIKQLLDEVEYDIRNYQNRGLCYLPKPKAEADNTDTRF